MIKEALLEIENTNFERELTAPIDENRIEGLKKVLSLNGLKTLEVGSLDGYHATQLSKSGAILTASDIRPDNLKKTLYRCLYEDIHNVNFRLLDVEDIPTKIEKDEFDLLFCSGLIYHLNMPHDFLFNIKDIFKYILLEGHVANEDKYPPLNTVLWKNWFLYYTNYSEVGYDDPQSAKDNRQSKWFTPDSWETIFKICNLKIVKTIYNDISNEHGTRYCWLLERK